MRRLRTITLFLALVVGFIPSCASVTARTGLMGPPADLYPGVGLLLAEANARGSMLPLESWFDTVLTAVDIPLTFAVDTVLLPVDFLYSGAQALLSGPEEIPVPPGYHDKRDPVPAEIGARR